MIEYENDGDESEVRVMAVNAQQATEIYLMLEERPPPGYRVVHTQIARHGRHGGRRRLAKFIMRRVDDREPLVKDWQAYLVEPAGRSPLSDPFRA